SPRQSRLLRLERTPKRRCRPETSQYFGGNRNLSASFDGKQRDVRKNGRPVPPRHNQKVQQQEVWKKNCQVQGGYHGRIRPCLFSHVSTPGPSCRGAACDVSDDGHSGIPEGWGSSPNDRPSKLYAS